MTLTSMAGTKYVAVVIRVVESFDANIVDETLLVFNFDAFAALVFNSFRSFCSFCICC